MNKNILIGIKAKNCAEYLDNLANQLCNLTYPHEMIHIVVIENDSEDNTWEKIENDFGPKLWHSGFMFSSEQKNFGYKLKPSHRHLPEVQEKRLKIIGEISQYIIDKYMEENDYLWWCDGDYTYLPPSMFEHLIGFDVDIVVPVCSLSDGTPYEISSNLDGLNLFQLKEKYPNTDLIEIDLASGSTLIRRNVFDSGVTHNTITGQQEGGSFSIRAKEKGFKIYASLKTIYHHAIIIGNIPLEQSNNEH
jgi:glycosyltransferase involved in cell wall biosynthesis